MNLLGARVARDSMGLGLQIGPHRISIDDVVGRWRGIDALVDREVIVGIRAEAFHHDPAGEFELSVRFHEQVGAVQWVHASIDAPVISATHAAGDDRRAEDGLVDDGAPADLAIVAALEGRGDVNRWAPLRIGVDHSQIYLFDHTGVAIEADPGLGGAAAA